MADKKAKPKAPELADITHEKKSPLRMRSSTMQMPSLRTLKKKQPPMRAQRTGLPALKAGLKAMAVPAIPALPDIGAAPAVGGGDKKRKK